MTVFLNDGLKEVLRCDDGGLIGLGYPPLGQWGIEWTGDNPRWAEGNRKNEREENKKIDYKTRLNTSS